MHPTIHRFIVIHHIIMTNITKTTFFPSTASRTSLYPGHHHHHHHPNHHHHYAHHNLHHQQHHPHNHSYRFQKDHCILNNWQKVSIINSKNIFIVIYSTIINVTIVLPNIILMHLRCNITSSWSTSSSTFLTSP